MLRYQNVFSEGYQANRADVCAFLATVSRNKAGGNLFHMSIYRRNHPVSPLMTRNNILMSSF